MESLPKDLIIILISILYIIQWKQIVVLNHFILIIKIKLTVMFTKLENIINVQ